MIPAKDLKINKDECNDMVILCTCMSNVMASGIDRKREKKVTDNHINVEIVDQTLSLLVRHFV